MARVRMVTRTITETTVEILGMDIESCTAKSLTHTVAGSFITDTSLMNRIKRDLDTDTFKVVVIKSITEKDVLYGMTEDEFIKCAKVLPSRTNRE